MNGGNLPVYARRWRQSFYHSQCVTGLNAHCWLFHSFKSIVKCCRHNHSFGDGRIAGIALEENESIVLEPLATAVRDAIEQWKATALSRLTGPAR